jgi:hypothetical protein
MFRVPNWKFITKRFKLTLPIRNTPFVRLRRTASWLSIIALEWLPQFSLLLGLIFAFALTPNVMSPALEVNMDARPYDMTVRLPVMAFRFPAG